MVGAAAPETARNAVKAKTARHEPQIIEKAYRINGRTIEMCALNIFYAFDLSMLDRIS